MYKSKKPNRTTINRNTSYHGETLEKKINRIVNNKEPIKDGAPIIYTDRKDGVQPQYDIRTDRFELAVDAMDKVNKDKLAQRDKRAVDREKTKIGDQAKKGMTAEGETPVNTSDN